MQTALQIAHGKWNDPRRPAHKLWLWMSTHRHARWYPRAQRDTRQKAWRACTWVYILCICRILPSWAQREIYCALPPEYSVTRYLEDKICSVTLPFIFIPVPVTLGVSVPEIGKWCCRKFTSSLWEQSHARLLSPTKQEAKNRTQLAHHHLNLAQEDVERGINTWESVFNVSTN